MIKKLLPAAAVLALLLTAAVAYIWFSRPLDVSFDALRSTIPHAENSNFAEVEGIRIHYQEKGSGTPIVLIHGYTSSVYTWKDEIDALAQKYHVIAVDLKGFGFSDKPDGDYTRRAQGELVAGLLDKLRIEHAWLAGNSMGGEVALNVAVYHPEKVLGLVLIDSSGVKFERKTSLTPWYLQIPVVGRVLIAMALTSDGLVRRGLENSFFDRSKVTDDRVAFYYQPLRTQGGQIGAVRAREQFEQLPIEDKLNSISVPTLIIWGADDELIPLASGKSMHELIRGSKMIVLQNCGHVPQEETPERVISEINNFIK
ncbi:MAG: alpha/beta hydrolase [Acidobacteriota bacterium]